MNKNCPTDEILLAQYFDGECTDAEAGEISQHLEHCDACRSTFAQIAVTLSEMDESLVPSHVPMSLTTRAMELFDQFNVERDYVSIIVKALNGFLSPIVGTPEATPALSLRSATTSSEDLSYHLTVGPLAVCVELSSALNDEIDVFVRPLEQVPAGWMIRLLENGQTRRLSSFDAQGIRVESLSLGSYIVQLENQQKEEHRFNLNLVTDSD